MTGEKEALEHQRKVGLRIKAAREGKGLSMNKAAQAAGISPSRWRQIELGYHLVQSKQKPANPSPEMLVAMARTVDLDTANLLKMAGFDPNMVEDDEVPESPIMLDLSGLTPENQARVRGFAEGLKAAQQ
jgi:transcriptional regulator with XRE-family HTH domain